MMANVTDGNGTTFTAHLTWREIGKVLGGSAIGISLAMAVATWFGFSPADVREDARWRQRMSLQMDDIQTHLQDHVHEAVASHQQMNSRLDEMDRALVMCCPPVAPRGTVPAGMRTKAVQR